MDAAPTELKTYFQRLSINIALLRSGRSSTCVETLAGQLALYTPMTPLVNTRQTGQFALLLSKETGMKRIVVLSLIAAIFFSLVTGDGRAVSQSAKSGLPTARPQDVAMSSERLARIRAGMQRYVDRGLVPGVVTLVARRGRVVHFEAIGYRDVEAKSPMTTDTIFRIASMTKPIA